jgi:hypothetical protein
MPDLPRKDKANGSLEASGRRFPNSRTCSSMRSRLEEGVSNRNRFSFKVEKVVLSIVSNEVMATVCHEASPVAKKMLHRISRHFRKTRDWLTSRLFFSDSGRFCSRCLGEHTVFILRGVFSV